MVDIPFVIRRGKKEEEEETKKKDRNHRAKL